MLYLPNGVVCRQRESSLKLLEPGFPDEWNLCLPALDWRNFCDLYSFHYENLY